MMLFLITMWLRSASCKEAHCVQLQKDAIRNSVQGVETPCFIFTIKKTTNYVNLNNKENSKKFNL